MSDTDNQKTPEDDAKEKDLAEREAALKAAEEELKEREAEIAAKEKDLAEQRATEQKQGFDDYAETLVKGGKIVPAEKEAVVSALIDIDNSESTFDFVEKGVVHKKTGVELIKGVLDRANGVVDFSEHTGTDPNRAGKPSFGDSDTAADDALHQKIQDFAEKNDITFAEAAIQFDGA